MKAPTFGPLANSRTIISREIFTVPLYPNLLTTSTTTATDVATTTAVTSESSAVTNISTDKVISTPTSANNDRESAALSYIKETKFNDIYDLVSESLVYLSILFFALCTQILNNSLTAVLVKLNDVILNATVSGVASSDPTDLTAAAYLLSATVNRLGNQMVQPAISEVCMYVLVYTRMGSIYIHLYNIKVFLSIASGFLDITQRQNERKENDVIITLYLFTKSLILCTHIVY